LKLLLDTHAVIWFTEDAHQLSTSAAAAIEDPTNDILLSAVVAWEIAIKRGVGKLRVANNYVDVMLAAGSRELPVAIAHARRVEKLPPHHSDPFDRLLVAQAMDENAAIVTNDERIRRYDVSVLW
jgi:PIN domain nuclease of toxin-antitoxin system